MEGFRSAMTERRGRKTVDLWMGTATVNLKTPVTSINRYIPAQATLVGHWF